MKNTLFSVALMLSFVGSAAHAEGLGSVPHLVATCHDANGRYRLTVQDLGGARDHWLRVARDGMGEILSQDGLQRYENTRTVSFQDSGTGAGLILLVLESPTAGRNIAAELSFRRTYHDPFTTVTLACDLY